MTRSARVRNLNSKAADVLNRTLRLGKGELDGELAATQVSRATTIIGLLLESLDDRYTSEKRRLAAATAWCGHMCWGVVELAAPRGPLVVIFQYWIWLILALAIIMLLIGALVADLGGSTAAGAITAAIGIFTGLMARTMRRKFGNLLPQIGTFALLVASVWFLFGVKDIWTLPRHYLAVLYFVVGTASAAVLCARAARTSFVRPHVSMALILAMALVTGLMDVAGHLGLRGGGEDPARHDTLVLVLAWSTIGGLALLAAVALIDDLLWTAVLIQKLVKGTVRLNLMGSAAATQVEVVKFVTGLQKATPPPAKERKERTLSAGAHEIIRRTVHLAEDNPGRITAARWVSRSLRVFGLMVREYSERRFQPAESVAIWIRRSGGILGGMIELAVPKSLGASLFHHWIWLVYALALAMLLIGEQSPGVRQAGVLVGEVAVAVHIVVGLLRAYFRGRPPLYAVALPAMLLTATFSLFLVRQMRELDDEIRRDGGAANMSRETKRFQTKAQFEEALGGESGRLKGNFVRMKRSLRRDFAFVPAYVGFFVAAGLFLTPGRRGSMWNRWAWGLVSLCAIVAGLGDLVENTRLYLLFNHDSPGWMMTATTVKWGGVGLTAGLLLVFAVLTVRQRAFRNR